MLTRRRTRLALTLAWLALAGTSCGDEREPRGRVSTSRDHLDAGVDGGRSRMDASSPRPDGGAILPPAEDELVLPFEGAAVRYPIEIVAEPGQLDVHLSIDTSGSIGGEIDTLQRDLRRIVNGLRDRVPDVSFGVSRFEDFPVAPYGSEGNGGDTGDTPFRLIAPITSDSLRIANAVATLDQPLGHGGDVPESSAEALWQIATGAGYEVDGETLIEPFDGRPARGGGSLGGVGFREGALRVVLHVTDAPSHHPRDYEPEFPGTHDLGEAAEALAGVGARLIGVVSGACAATPIGCDELLYALTRADLERLALATSAHVASEDGETCPFGLEGRDVPSVGDRCPLVFDVADDGAGLTSALTDSIVQLVDAVRFDAVTGAAGDDPLGFVQRVIPEDDGDEDAQIADLLPEAEPDGEPDSFVQVHAGARLRFQVELRNTRIRPSDADQHFRIVVQIAGDGLTLERHTLRVRVPSGSNIAPEPPPVEVGPRMDAGTPDEDAGG